jgi:2-phospho-L-lactate transferase/gluconeogenesis factor (CofD/UPF0052 family)
VFPTQQAAADLRIVLFSGGRGSGALAELVATDPRIALTIAINGYDDGASTGEVRRFLGDALGPSDFRKNASRLARLRQTCPTALIELLDRRLPADATSDDIRELINSLETGTGADVATIGEAARLRTASRLRRFDESFRQRSASLSFGGAAVGNFVFAGGFLETGRNFNPAVDDYCALVGLPAGLVENVTSGTNAFLVALDIDGRLLGSEEEIVDAKRHNRVSEIFLIDRPLDTAERARLGRLRPDAIRQSLAARIVTAEINPRLVDALASADLIIYAPGTQHSSLFPSYLTHGLSQAIAANLDAVKLLVTNIQTDAEITGSSAVDLIDRAVFYLREKDSSETPAPCLITHYLLNDPAHADTVSPYVPLGRLDSLEDPRLVRVGNYEAGASGRHDAAKVLAPFIQRFLARERSVQRVAVVLYETRSANKIAQTMLEMVRGGLRGLKVNVTVFHSSESGIDQELVQRLPFRVHRAGASPGDLDRDVLAAVRAGDFDYVILFDSSGMYNGEDVAGLASHLTLGRLDAVWGSRRLSVRDIEESYRLKYQKKALLGGISYFGSHMLSLLYLALYGRYVSDTLSAARAIRASDALALPCPLTSKVANHHLLPALLRRRAEMLEIPVQFFSISPDRVRRTSVFDGLMAVGIAVAGRLKPAPRPATALTGDKPADPQRHRAWTGS